MDAGRGSLTASRDATDLSPGAGQNPTRWVTHVVHRVALDGRVRLHHGRVSQGRCDAAGAHQNNAVHFEYQLRVHMVLMGHEHCVEGQSAARAFMVDGEELRFREHPVARGRDDWRANSCRFGTCSRSRRTAVTRW